MNIEQAVKYMRNQRNYYAVERRAQEKDRTAIWLLRYWHIYVSVSEIEGRNDNVEKQLIDYFSRYIKREASQNNPVFKAGYSKAVIYHERQTTKRSPVPSEDDHDKYRADWPMFIAGFNEGILSTRKDQDGTDGKGTGGALSEV